MRLKWNNDVNYNTGLKRYVAVYGGVIGAPDAYPCLFCEIIGGKSYDNMGKSQTMYQVNGSITYKKVRGNGFKRVDLIKETKTLQEAKDFVQAEFDKIVK